MEPHKYYFKTAKKYQASGINVNIFYAKSGKFFSSQKFIYKNKIPYPQQSTHYKTNHPTNSIKTSNNFHLLEERELNANYPNHAINKIIKIATDNGKGPTSYTKHSTFYPIA